MKYEQVSEWIVDFLKRFLFQSTFLLIFPLLAINGLENQHYQFINDHHYSNVLQQIKRLPSEQQQSIRAYMNGEFTFQYKILFLIPLLFLVLEIYEVYKNKQEESQPQIVQSFMPPPPILQPKAISEYVTEKNEEIQQAESYYRHQNQIMEAVRDETNKSKFSRPSQSDFVNKQADETKKSQLSNHSQVDLLNKLQFTLDGKQQDRILQSEYINNRLAIARHLGRILEQDQFAASPQFKTVRTQTIKDQSFVQTTQNTTKIDAQIQKISLLQIIFGYLAGIQNRLVLSIILIALSSSVQICLFNEWMIFSNNNYQHSLSTINGNLLNVTLHIVYNIYVAWFLFESNFDTTQLLYFVCVLHQTLHKIVWNLDYKANLYCFRNFSNNFNFYNNFVQILLMQFPPTSGKVIMDTSHGELEIELWCKEIQKGCKNFIQHCLDGYYDNCKFHRLIPNFMIQGGDPTGTGDGGQSIYGAPFQDEFHSRLTFCTRGILAYSNEGPNTNGSQFFITFDSCSWLDKRHTIFGRIVGNTIYNLMSMNSIDTDENDSPVQPIFIKSTQVIIDPYNLTATNVIKSKSPIKEEVQEVQQKPIQKPKQKSKNINVLSFGDEEEEVQEQRGKIVNSHDVLDDPKLKKDNAISKEELELKKKKKQEEEEKVAQLKNALVNKNKKEAADVQHRQKAQIIDDEVLQNINEVDRQLLNYKIKRNEKGEIQYVFNQQSSESEEESSEIEDEELRQQREKQFEEYEKLKADYLQFKENKFGSNNPMIRDRLDHEKKLQSTVEQRRARFIQNLKEQQKNEDFEKKVQKIKERITDEKIMSDKYHWLNHKLKFHIDSANAYKVVETKEKVQDFHASDLVGEDTYKSKKEQKNIEKLLKLSEQ